MMDESQALQWARQILDAEYPRETLVRRIAYTLMEASILATPPRPGEEPANTEQ